ncbi:hypothetical protein IT570_12480 [Candidatus Sumerlaeota bacterium]|nr:hypothetical protein [Candidatus Sumerlaeota bacterium]
MKKNLPYFAFAAAIFSVIFYQIGVPWLCIIPIALTLLFSAITLVQPDRDHPVSARVAALLAIPLAFTPVLVPWVKSVHYDYMSARRAKVTAPLYAKLDDSVKELQPAVGAYYKKFSVMPDLTGRETMQLALDRAGNPAKLPSMEGIRAPNDPFAKDSSPLRWVAVRDAGVLLVSVGQDGTAEMPLPGVLMDRPPANRLAGFAMTGVDPRMVTYDPTNGALSLGDDPRFIGEKSYEETFKPLFEAWNDADRVSPYRPTIPTYANEPDPNPQSVRDAKGAAELLAKKKYLAALCLASRAMNFRVPQQASWKPEEFDVERTRGYALYHLAAFREAADVLVDYAQVRPNEPYTHYIMGAALYYGGNAEDAKKHLAAASQISATDPIANYAESAYQQIIGNKQPTSLPQPEAPDRQ